MSRTGVAVLLFSLLQLGNAANNPDETMDGYSPAHAVAERDWESKFRNLPNPETMRDSMQHLSARPHNVGSPYDKENAEWMLAKFKQYGFDAHIETLRCAVSHAEGTSRRVAVSHALCGQTTRAAAQHRSDLATDFRATADLQRVLRRWRR